uniref:Uncharacterized protein n=1 Tax=Ananas comosus var. bracteatus TaxID=296719 RepID=A0A6V7Q0U4_ANACO|nr:unnamed protein product [Ananas comosus var. bracteatus]
MGCRVVLHPFCDVFVFVFVLALFVGNARGDGPQRPNGPKEVHLVGPQRLGGGPDELLPGRSPPPQPSAAFTDGQKDPLPPPPPSTTDKNSQKSDERLHRLLWSRRFGPWGPPVVKSLDALPPSEIVYPPPPPTGAKNDQSGFRRFPWPPDEP